jgi:hypothetical protein
MPRFRKIPVEIEAIQWKGDNASAFVEWAIQSERTFTVCGDEMQIETLEGTMTANIGDWIIRGVEGEFYPCKPGIFAKTYEAV